MQPPSAQCSTSAQRSLPDKDVTSAASLEDAYVAFILCCNPAVPLETDTATLRESFRVPPKSGGKAFSTYNLFQLIKKLETKELKTWAELALKLGVEPPDTEKGESAQKIQQYAVRLKRWMHSMHIDAFFEYLIGRESSYCTEIPAEQIPITELERDGVAAEDDMALRALLPQIKPRRAHFVSSILQGEWYDSAQNRIPTCSVDEAWALYRRVVENLLASAPSRRRF
ncbi:hypothetical protein N0V88_000027 [Collariella sp. IMI 366227]|nr:hypothetical protein N0V88_000027 [Collariella sp. IMI 366227]